MYNVKCMSAEQALGMIKSGDRVVLGHAAGEPKVLVETLLSQSQRLSDVEIVHMVPLYGCEYSKPEYQRNFRHNALFVGAPSREAVSTKRADYTPCYFSEIPRLFRDRILPVDVALIQVSPPDRQGYMS